MGRRRLTVKEWLHLKLLILICVCFLAEKVRVFASDSDKSALLELKNSILDPSGVLSSWDSTSTSGHCSWYGVTCDSNHFVVALNVTGGGGGGDSYSTSCARVSGFPLYGFGIRRSCSNVRSSIHGKLSSAIAKLVELRILSLPFNELNGEIPDEIWGMDKLEVLDLEWNLISGSLPVQFKSMKNLRVLNLGFNQIMGNIPNSLLSSTPLQILNLAGNHLNGSIPSLNFWFRNLKGLYLSFNQLTGSIPGDIGLNCPELEHLELSGNYLTGEIPHSLGNCTRLRSVLLYSNSLVNLIPSEFGSLRQLEVLDLSRNRLSGAIPPEIGNCSMLSILVLSNTWDFLPNLMRKSGLTNDEYNFYTGTIPLEITRMTSLRMLWVPRTTTLVGKLPNWVSCDNSKMVNFAYNFNSGGISDRFRLFDVSSNALSGHIQKFFRNGFSNVQPVFDDANDLSSSYLFHFGKEEIRMEESPIEVYKPYLASRRMKFLEDPQNHDVTPPSNLVQRNGNDGLNSIEIASISSAAAIFTVLVALVVLFLYTRKCGSRPRVSGGSVKKEVTVFTDIGVPLNFENVVNGTSNFNASNCIGNGGFGATFKAEIAPGVLVAIKRLAIGRFQGFQQFEAEIKTLGRLRHPNLVTLVGYHASETEMFLIYNYLPGGNLEKFIQERSTRALNWRVLHKIALDVARALAYLHDQCVPRVLHRDVKPSNILLDEGFNAYLSDFGLARLLGTSETHVTTGVAGTFGYVAPEYAMTCRVSDKADVYSYGVVLLELISDKKALDPSFSPYGNGFNIVTWGSMLLRKGRAKEFFTPGLWESGPHDDLVEILHLAVLCTVDSLSVRPTMKVAVKRLKQLQPPSP